MTRPLVLLDVDGVLNALPDAPQAGRRWRTGWAGADGTKWSITFDPAVVERLATWHADGVVELQWLTTWGHDANGELRILLGLPHLTVAGTYEGEDGATAGLGNTHAAVAPSAPDPLSGRWWKYDVVRRVLAAQPDRDVVWVDDELHDAASPYRRWGAGQPRLFVVGPAPIYGVTEADLAGIAASFRTGTDAPKASS